MFRVTAGETITRAVTVPGSGALSTETFTVEARDQIGRSLSASAEITDAAAREVTATVAPSEWTYGSGGFGRLEVMMQADGAKSVVASERFRVMPGLSPQSSPTDY